MSIEVERATLEVILRKAFYSGRVPFLIGEDLRIELLTKILQAADETNQAKQREQQPA